MKKIRFFKQHSLETCGISCVLMALDYFGAGFPTVRKETDFYNIYRIKTKRYVNMRPERMKGTLGASLALALSRNGLDAALFHASENMLENRNGYYPDSLHSDLLNEHRACIERADGAFRVQTGVPITAGLMRRELAQDRLLIVQCFIEGDVDDMHDHVMHWILLYDFEGDTFLAYDPLYGKRQFGEAELLDYMETPFAPSFLSVGR